MPNINKLPTKKHKINGIDTEFNTGDFVHGKDFPFFNRYRDSDLIYQVQENGTLKPALNLSTQWMEPSLPDHKKAYLHATQILKDLGYGPIKPRTKHDIDLSDGDGTKLLPNTPHIPLAGPGRLDSLYNVGIEACARTANCISSKMMDQNYKGNAWDLVYKGFPFGMVSWPTETIADGYSYPLQVDRTSKQSIKKSGTRANIAAMDSISRIPNLINKLQTGDRMHLANKRYSSWDRYITDPNFKVPMKPGGNGSYPNSHTGVVAMLGGTPFVLHNEHYGLRYDRLLPNMQLKGSEFRPTRIIRK